MLTKTYETQEEWLEDRKGKITGSRLSNIVVKRGTGEKIGFYEIIAERIAEPADDEDVMDRGHRLETEAIQLFAKAKKKKVDTSLVMWQREDNSSIAISPDGFIGNKEAVEVKCLSSARHLEAVLTKQIPSEYEYQVLQYFIVNDQLQTLWFVMYDPRMPEKIRLHTFEIKRESLQDDISQYLDYQKQKLEDIENIITELTF